MGQHKGQHVLMVVVTVCSVCEHAPEHCSYVMLALAAPTLAQKPPGSHKSHAVAPGVLLNVPASHAPHMELPPLAANFPGKQLMQTAPESSARFPDGHASQLRLPAFLLKVPRTHGVQPWSPLPDMAEEDPGTHKMQLAFVAAPGAGR
tara:strand:+ start:654 stop:1097 length:444 start_codon:yes stop_codon:yes gene_type:complete